MSTFPGCLVLPGNGTLHKSPFSKNELAALLYCMCDITEQKQAELELTLLTDKDMECLHYDALGLCGPTNILAFPMEQPEVDETRSANSNDNKSFSGPFFLGYLALSVDTLRREAFLYHQPLEHHCIRLLTHGFVHLLGFDHGPDMDAACQKIEDSLLQQFCLNISL